MKNEFMYCLIVCLMFAGRSGWRVHAVSCLASAGQVGVGARKRQVNRIRLPRPSDSRCRIKPSLMNKMRYFVQTYTITNYIIKSRTIIIINKLNKKTVTRFKSPDSTIGVQETNVPV